MPGSHLALPARRMAAFYCSLLISVLPAHAERLVAVDAMHGVMMEINPDTRTLSDAVQLDFVDAPRNGEYYKGAAVHPANGLVYLILDYGSRPILATLDLETKVMTGLVSLGEGDAPDDYASITFGPAPDYPLYAITGDNQDGSVASDIHEIDAVTGEVTATGWEVSGTQTHAVEYNPDDGFLYHFYSTGIYSQAEGHLERINLATGVTAQVGLTGVSYSEADGVARLNGKFYIYSGLDNQLFSVTSGGYVERRGIIQSFFRNLFSDGEKLYGLGNRSGKHLYVFSAEFGDEESWSPIEKFVGYRQVRGLARSPVTGVLHVLAYPEYPAPQRPELLAELDPLTGDLSNPVTLSVTNLSDLAFDSAGNLYGVASNDVSPARPGELESGTIATINVSTGQVSALPWLTNRDLSKPHALAFHPLVGKLYHAVPQKYGVSGAAILETIDPADDEVTDIRLRYGLPGGRTSALAISPRNGGLYLTIDDRLYSLRTDGTLIAYLASMSSFAPHGLAFLPDMHLTIHGVSPAGASLSWESQPNRRYGLYSSHDLVSWTPVPGFTDVSSTPPRNTAAGVPLPAPESGYFRLGPPAE